jgi:hypothetical protein
MRAKTDQLRADTDEKDDYSSCRNKLVIYSCDNVWVEPWEMQNQNDVLFSAYFSSYKR